MCRVMSADVIHIADRKASDQRSVAREALVNTLAQTVPTNSSILADEILIGLWMRGFKVVPLSPDDLGVDRNKVVPIDGTE